MNEERLIHRLEKVLKEEGTSTKAIGIFRRIILDHHKRHRRSLPWRKTRNPYRIVVSEIMLQQTQVERVMDKYSLLIKTFPDFSSLATVPLPEILAVWQGLGYNRRAIALKRIAQTVMTDFHGKLPSSKEELLRLPGIGDYTASAILAFAFDQPTVFIETNIRRVFIHFFFGDRASVSDADILPLVSETLPRNDPREWYYALMDYGSMLGKKMANPNRRSAHYSRQSRFQGSDRQVRGMILKTMLEKKELSKKELIAKLGLDPKRVEDNLASLVKEGFLKKQGRRFSIAG
jgi:A/G-specific adenine glycosylase